MPKAEYRRGQGPNALPQGGAAAANRRQPPPSAFEDGDIPVQFAPGIEPPISEEELPQSEDLDVLLADPNPGFLPPAVPDRAGRVPRYVVRHLPQLMAAARDPGAPPTLLALYRAVVRQLEQERKLGER